MISVQSNCHSDKGGIWTRTDALLRQAQHIALVSMTKHCAVLYFTLKLLFKKIEKFSSTVLSKMCKIVALNHSLARLFYPHYWR